MSGQVPEEAGERAQLQVVVGAQEVQQHWQHAFLLHGHLAQHRSPLQGRARDGGGGRWGSKSVPSVCGRPKKQVGVEAHPLLSGRDVLQSSGRRLSGRGVDVALVQYAVVQTDHLGVPQPLHPPGHPGHLAEGGEVLALSLSSQVGLQ